MQTTSALIHCLCAAKAVPMNGAPSSNADKAAFRRLQENEQVQYLQKNAAQKIRLDHIIMSVSEWLFCTKCNFLLPLRQHIFRQ